MNHLGKAHLIGGLLGILFTGSVQAAPIAIADLPQETSGPFRHNVFHTADANSGQNGSVLAWFDLGVGGGSWDPVTGAFNISIDLFSDSGLTTSIGTASGAGTLVAAEFNGNDGGLIGSIDWDFDATAEGNGLFDSTTFFIDIFYATSDAGYTANSTDGTYDFMTLWGANGGFDLTDGSFTNSTLGVDLVVQFVPIPASVWLLTSGLIGLITVSRRRKGFAA